MLPSTGIDSAGTPSMGKPAKLRPAKALSPMPNTVSASPVATWLACNVSVRNANNTARPTEAAAAAT